MAPGAQDTWLELQRRLASHVSGPARSRYITELQQGLSIALFKGIGRQLLALNLVLERGYVEATGRHKDHLPNRGAEVPGDGSENAGDEATPVELD